MRGRTVTETQRQEVVRNYCTESQRLRTINAKIPCYQRYCGTNNANRMNAKAETTYRNGYRKLKDFYKVLIKY